MKSPDDTPGVAGRVLPEGADVRAGCDHPSEPVSLRALRRRHGKSLRAMAAEIGVSQRVLNYAEHGGVPLPANQLAIAAFYGLDVLVQWPEPDPAQAVA